MISTYVYVVAELFINTNEMQINIPLLCAPVTLYDSNC